MHSDLQKLRSMLIETHLADLRDQVSQSAAAAAVHHKLLKGSAFGLGCDANSPKFQAKLVVGSRIRPAKAAPPSFKRKLIFPIYLADSRDPLRGVPFGLHHEAHQRRSRSAAASPQGAQVYQSLFN